MSVIHFKKEDVEIASNGLWDRIIQDLCGLSGELFNTKKEHPCPLCGGKTRFRFIPRHDLPFFCNHCGSKSGIEFYRAITGVGYCTAIDDIGNYLNCMSVEKRKHINHNAVISRKFPDNYDYNFDLYQKALSLSVVKISQWQMINGLNELDLLAINNSAIVPLLDNKGNQCDLIGIDIDGNWQTTSKNKHVPFGFYSVFGKNDGKRVYATVNPLTAAHASICTNTKIICCWTVDNLMSIANINYFNDLVIIVANKDEAQEADSLALKQIKFKSKTNTVEKRIYKPFELTGA